MLKAIKQRNLQLLRKKVQTPIFGRLSSTISQYAFAFDIDGVLLRGSETLKEGTLALQTLNRARLPWILLTNGGGKSESSRVVDLSQKLDVPIDIRQIVQSHTPFKELAKKYNRVLVIGGDGDICRGVAQEYGFRDVVRTTDIIRANPTIWPYSRFSATELEEWTRPDYLDLYNSSSELGSIDAILVFNDPRDWGSDIQIVLDLLCSQNGRLGTRRDLNQNHTSSNNLKIPAIPIHFSNNDMLWANDYPLPRFGQGAFRSIVQRLYKDLTGTDLVYTVIGKPEAETYDFGYKMLASWREQHLGLTEDSLKKVYMVGDNPASDIMGANNYGWDSMLVRTGVFQDGDLPTIVAKPKYIFNDVLEAVNFAIQKHS
ncbi:HAD-superfamily hydrolase [Nadsonia fulvescens var. elongata DSM 6958]|uniref:HAD-superfamily hydrolase n=1 Tax=Nadsonia fulvescens var. elongata DSM 6958 TaxID=857566 RepID=A0A1E3PQP3_9ASCO|nr:HAD-superfamily hydrolase [Nadsonia fulvescens var. elongata DSM 6958]